MVDMIQFWSNQVIKHGVNLEQILEAICHASNPESELTQVPLKTEDIIRAVNREQALLLNYRDRKEYLHSAG